MIKTLNRREKVAALVASIERLYPRRLRILIGDDGEVDERQLYAQDGIVEGNRIRYFWFGFDIGAGAGRNRLVSCTLFYKKNFVSDTRFTGLRFTIYGVRFTVYG